MGGRERENKESGIILLPVQTVPLRQQIDKERTLSTKVFQPINEEVRECFGTPNE